MYIVTYNVEDVIRFGVREELEEAEELFSEWLEYAGAEQIKKTDNKIEIVEVDDIELCDILFDIYHDGDTEFDFRLDKETIRKCYMQNNKWIIVGE